MRLDQDAANLAQDAQTALAKSANALAHQLKALRDGNADGVSDDAPVRLLRLCDQIDATPSTNDERAPLETRRWWLLAAMLRTDRAAYVESASFLRDRIPREALPSVIGVDLPTRNDAAASETSDDGLVADCPLPEQVYRDNPLDVLLLALFRRLVQKETGYSSSKSGFDGLVDEGREYMLRATDEQQNAMVFNTLARLLTPAMPLIFRPFMSGVALAEDGDATATPQPLGGGALGFARDTVEGARFGPWLYAPLITSVVTPPFFNFLVGPSTPNLRADGRPGGLLVQKCRFLQQSNCKGICLQMCKLPAQDYFQKRLGMPLNVQPIFETQECQWSFGEVPLPPEEDPLLPGGCITGCTSRVAMAEARVSRPAPCL